MDSEDFKSFCRALITSGVGSIPTRSRQRPWSDFGRGLAIAGVVTMSAGVLLVATAWSAPGKSAAGSPAPAVEDTLARSVSVEEMLAPVVEDTLAEASGIDDRPDSSPSHPVETRPSVAWTTIKSGILPGWGQWTNKKPVKAGLFFGAYVFFAAQAFVAEQDRKDAQSVYDDSGLPEDLESVNAAVDRRNSRLWWMGGVALFSMLDAYVDVHFWKFEDQWSARVGPTPDGGAALALRLEFD